MDQKKIEDLRAQIDDIDSELVRLLLLRLNCSVAIGQEKNSGKMPLFDQKREKEIIDRVKKKLPDETFSQEIELIYACLLQVSKSAQAKHLEEEI